LGHTQGKARSGNSGPKERGYLMTKTKVHHVFDREDVARSLADKVRVTALCGLVKVVDPETINDTDVKNCQRCMRVWRTHFPGSTLHARYQPPTERRSYYSFTFKNKGTWQVKP
jgi:hypothetical protein